MYPLIEIKTVPIEIEIKTSPAKLEYTRGTADLEITRDDGSLSIKSRPIKLNIDTFEARNSVVPTAMRSVEQYAQEGQEASYTATATYARHGQMLLNAKFGEDVITQFASEAILKDYKPNSGIEFLPSVPPEISVDDPGEMQIRYEMDKLNFDWRISQPEFKFTPGDIELHVTQKPDVIIKYVGGPLYIPRSSDPNYEPVDVEA